MSMFQNTRILIYDGAIGTMLQAAGLESGQIPDLWSVTNPEPVIAIHKQYVDAGSDIICANTFGSNGYNLRNADYSVDEVITAAIANAKKAADGRALVALDIGPTGAPMAPMGTHTFDQIYDFFKEMAISGEKAGADCVAIETMYNLPELRAAMLAVKEHTSLPMLVTMTFEPTGKSFYGVSAESFAAVAQGLGAEALGINCSYGPDRMLEIVKRMSAVSSLPLIVKPNAGLPDPETGKYSMKAGQFAILMEQFVDCGAGLVGGCCGTDPSFIAALSRTMEGEIRQKYRACDTVFACTAAQCVALDENAMIGNCLLGETPTPAGCSAPFLQALQAGDGNAVWNLMGEDLRDGANLVCYPLVDGFPENNVKILEHIQQFLQAPLVFVAKSPETLELALRAFQGKACVLADDTADLDALSVHIIKYGAALLGG